MIDLRSDTVTKPTAAMLKAMMKADVGDDVYKEDPSLNRLEKKAAALFGKDRALFFPSGTMANQAAVKLQTQPGDQLICDKWAHVYNFEGGGLAFNSGISCRLVDGHRGMIGLDQVKAAVNDPKDIHSAPTRIVSLENTTNKGGGACYDLREIEEISAFCHRQNLAIHLDGARLFNALVAKNESPEVYGRCFDTVSICLSKGLGCPVGTLLLFDEHLYQKALRIRKLLGGAMRQAGYLAAAGSYALDHHIERLAEDHKKAKALGETLSGMPEVSRVEPVETNIVIFGLKESRREKQFLEKLAQKDILISSMGEGKLRMVTHLDYSDTDHQKLMEILKSMKI